MKQCLQESMEKAEKSKKFPSLYKIRYHEIFINEVNMTNQEIDCAYNVDMNAIHRNIWIESETMYLSFVIKQNSCISGDDIIGGASLYVTVSNSQFKSYCGVRDQFDNTYVVFCRLPIPIPVPIPISPINVSSESNNYNNRTSNDRSQSVNNNDTSRGNKSNHSTLRSLSSSISLLHCMNVTAVLEHEHYDAFGREGGLPSGKRGLFYDAFCFSLIRPY